MNISHFLCQLYTLVFMIFIYFPVLLLHWLGHPRQWWIAIVRQPIIRKIITLSILTLAFTVDFSYVALSCWRSSLTSPTQNFCCDFLLVFFIMNVKFAKCFFCIYWHIIFPPWFCECGEVNWLIFEMFKQTTIQG